MSNDRPELQDLYGDNLLTIAFQPIVRLREGRMVAWEALGRYDLSDSAVGLFDLAGTLTPDVEAELSLLFRRKAVELVKDLPEPPCVFLNTHPLELDRPGLLESLKELRSCAPHVDLVLDIHESALVRTEFIIWLRTRLSAMNVGLAYSNFGTGHARLEEIAAALPHYLKFDQRLIFGLDQAPLANRLQLESLVSLARKLQAMLVAVGIESAAEAQVCAEIGFTHGQGLHLGEPRTIEELRGNP